MTYRTDVFRIPMRGPSDVSGLVALFDSGALDPHTIIGILGKTEGNGGVNDFTRAYAHHLFAETLAPRMGIAPHEVDERIAIIMSGGTEGVLSPHATIFAKVPTPARHPELVEGQPQSTLSSEQKRLAIGVASTRDFLPEELGRAAQIEATAIAVREAMARRRHQHTGRRALRADQMPAAHRRARRRSRAPAATNPQPTMRTPRWAIHAAHRRSASRSRSARSRARSPTRWCLPIIRLASAVASTSAGIELMRNVDHRDGQCRRPRGRFAHRPRRDARRDRSRRRSRRVCRRRTRRIDRRQRRSRVTHRERFRKSGVVARRHDPRRAPHDARRYRHQRDASRACGGRRIARRDLPAPAKFTSPAARNIKARPVGDRSR